MSDYSSTYNGATKDATNATILASNIQTEFDSISTAIATKADVAASPIANEIPITTAGGDLTNSGVYASGGAIRDSNGNEVIIPEGVASAVNEVTVVNAATTVNPRIQSSGEANTGLIIADSNDNEVIIAESVASAVNEITVTNAAAGNLPSINQTGSGNVGLTVEGVSIVNGVMTGISAATITTMTGNVTGNVTGDLTGNVTGKVNTIKTYAGSYSTGNIAAGGTQTTTVTEATTGITEIYGVVVSRRITAGHSNYDEIAFSVLDDTGNVAIDGGVGGWTSGSTATSGNINLRTKNTSGTTAVTVTINYILMGTGP